MGGKTEDNKPPETDRKESNLPEDGIEQSTAELAAKHGAGKTVSTEEQREKWRQDKIRQRQKQIADTGKIPSDATGSVTPTSPTRAPVLPSTIRACFENSVVTLNGVVRRTVHGKVIRITRNKNTPGGDKVLAHDFEEKADVGLERKKQIVDAATSVAIKYQFIGENMPEITLASGLTAWATEIGLLLADLNRLVDRVEQQNQHHETKA